MSDTPRTDAAIRAAQGKWTFQLRDQMKRMEVELNAANTELARLRSGGCARDQLAARVKELEAYAERLEQAGDGMHQYLMDEYGTQHVICMIHWREEKGRTA